MIPHTHQEGGELFKRQFTPEEALEQGQSMHSDLHGVMITDQMGQQTRGWMLAWILDDTEEQSLLANALTSHCAQLLQSCPTHCSLMDCSLPCSSVHGILQARLEWVAVLSSRGSSQPRDQTASLISPALAGRFFTTSATRKPMSLSRRDFYSFCVCV